MRKLLALHRWIGWLLTPVLAISAVTGAVLQWMQPWPQAPAAAPPVAQIAAAIDVGLPAIAAQHPELRMAYIDLPRSAAETIEVHLLPRGPRGVESWASLDAASGALLGVRADGADAHSWIFNLHQQLLLGEAGTWVLGGVAALVIVSLAIALRLWLRMGRLRAPTARRRWHRRIGIAMLLPLAMMLATGFTLSWPEAVRWPLGALDGGKRLASPKLPVAPPEVPRIGPGRALLLGAAALPDAVPTRLYAARAGSFRLRLRSDEWHPNGLNNVYIAEADGRIVQTTPWRDLPLSAIYANWVYPLHIGWLPSGDSRVAAAVMRVVWTGFALSLAWMVFSGLPRRRRKAASA
jgi:uncharacterized iron-regulated membrane protein